MPAPKSQLAAAWLEACPPGQSTPEQVDIQETPFTIGRNGTCHLPIDSGLVSREHAEITHDGEAWLLRDLGSTNGTMLNGKRIETARLSDGDVVKVADMEFSFCCGGSSRERKTVTQVMTLQRGGDGEKDSSGDTDTHELIRDVRRLRERLLTCGTVVEYHPIAASADGALLGYQSQVRDRGHSSSERMLLATECRLTAQLREMERLAAVEQAQAFEKHVRLFLPLDTADVGADDVVESLTELVELRPAEGSLVLQIPAAAVCDIPHFRDFLSRLARSGAGVAFHGFTGNAAQIGQLSDIAPDYLQLAASLIRRLAKHRDERGKLKELVKAAEELGCEVIADGVETREAADDCRELGVHYLAGGHVGACAPINRLTGSAACPS